MPDYIYKTVTIAFAKTIALRDISFIKSLVNDGTYLTSKPLYENVSEFTPKLLGLYTFETKDEQMDIYSEDELQNVCHNNLKNIANPAILKRVMMQL